MMARIPEPAVRNTAAASARIARQTEAWLKSGNKINEIERGKSAFYTPDGKDSATQRAVAIAITTPSKSDHIQQKRRNKKHEANQAKRRKKILYVLSKHPDGLSRNAISEKTEIGRTVLLKLIKEMAFAGTVRLQGKYLVKCYGSGGERDSLPSIPPASQTPDLLVASVPMQTESAYGP